MLGKILLTGFGLITFGLTRFFFNVLVLRALSPAFLGEVNQTLSIFLLFPVFYAPALGNVVSRFAAEFLGAGQSEKARRIFSLSFLVVVAASAVGTIAALELFPFLRGDLHVERTTLLALAPMLALNSFYSFLKSSYYGFDRVSKCLANDLVSSLAFFAVLAAALLTRSRVLATLPFSVHALVFSGIAIVHLRDQFQFRALLRGMAGDLRRCGHFFFCTVVNSLTGPGAFHLGIVLTGRLTGSAELAAYYAVLLYSLQPLNLVPVSLVTVMMPAISRHYGAGRLEEGVGTSERSFRPLFLLLTLVCGGCAILGREAVAVIAGPDQGDLLAPFLIILGGMYVIMASSAPGILLNATKHIGQIAASGAVSAVAAVALWYWAIPAYGVAGSALGYTVLQTGKGLWAIAAARRLLGWRARMGWSPLGALGALVVGAGLSLATRALWIHIVLAAAFAALILTVHAGDLRDYLNRLLAKVRSNAAKVRKPADDLMSDDC